MECVSLHVVQMFYSLVEADWAVSTKFHLVGLVCYYGHHYSTFFFHSKMKIWILFDDSHVKKVLHFAISFALFIFCVKKNVFCHVRSNFPNMQSILQVGLSV